MGSQRSYTWLAARFANISKLKVPFARQREPVNQVFLGYLCQRWNEDTPTALQLFEELQQRGVQGKLSIVKDFVTRLRRGLPGLKYPPKSLTTKRVPPMLSPRELR